MTLPFVQSLLRDRFLHLLLIIACVLSVMVPFVPASWPAAIDWHTIITLSGLMLLTKGIELSGYFDVLGRKMARRFVTERQLAMFMVLAAALLSTFLTNDVALFIVVPLTLILPHVAGLGVNGVFLAEPISNVIGGLACYLTMRRTVMPERSAMEAAQKPDMTAKRPGPPGPGRFCCDPGGKFGVHPPLVLPHQHHREHRGQQVADGLGEEDAVDLPHQGQQVEERHQEHHLPQQRDEHRRHRPVDGLEEGSGQHDEAQHRGDAEVDAQAGHTDVEHLLGAAESRQDLPGKDQHRQPDHAGAPTDRAVARRKVCMTRL